MKHQEHRGKKVKLEMPMPMQEHMMSEEDMKKMRMKHKKGK